MSNYRLVVEYDGTNYHGFQIQPGDLTIQECIESAISKLAGTPIRITSAGRTDAGVHALYQVINFHSDFTVPVDKIPVAINSLLPKDIRVKEASLVSDTFHARFDAVSKTYMYNVDQSKIEPVFTRNYCWWIKNKIDWEQVFTSGKELVGVHDFAAFAASGSSVKSTVRNITKFDIQVDGAQVKLWFSANGFLYNMVRNMVGTLVEIGSGKRPESISEIIASRDRAQAGITAPARGLFLERVLYRD